MTDNPSMELSQIFYLSGTIFFIVFSIAAVFVGYEIILMVRTLRSVAGRATDIAQNFKQVSTGMQFGLWALVTKLLGTVRGGDK